MLSISRGSLAIRPPRVLALVVVLAALAVAALPAGASAAASKAQAKPTVVLVHGAFADASGWAKVTSRLQHRGYTVIAPANPLRGVSADAAYLRTYLTTIKGPIVLVGHSYGGFVITNAATGNPNIKALVYVAAYAPDEGDTVAALGAKVPGGRVGPATLDITPFPNPDGSQGQEGAIKPSVFHEIFCADLPASQAAIMATAQRPASLATLGEPSGPPAWKSIHSYYQVAGKDLAIGTALERFMAKRMNATTIETQGASHVAMMSHPAETTRLILRAATAG
jgi:pimeloyl-ACP methyl ester carboxylesterase